MRKSFYRSDYHPGVRCVVFRVEGPAPLGWTHACVDRHSTSVNSSPPLVPRCNPLRRQNRRLVSSRRRKMSWTLCLCARVDRSLTPQVSSRFEISSYPLCRQAYPQFWQNPKIIARANVCRCVCVCVSIARLGSIYFARAALLPAGLGWPKYSSASASVPSETAECHLAWSIVSGSGWPILAKMNSERTRDGDRQILGAADVRVTMDAAWSRVLRTSNVSS